MACGDEPLNPDNSEKDSPTPLAPAHRNVIVYMMAENSLSQYAQKDINEMVEAADCIPTDCNVVIYLDDVKSPRIYTLNRQQGLSEYITLPEQCSTNATTFQDNMDFIRRKCPAEHYGLVMWSHGSGWIPAQKKTVGIDNMQNKDNLDNGTELDICDMKRAIRNVGLHFDWILFDVCFMQCVESDYELRDVADYIIASPAELPGDGAPYDKIMTAMMADEGAAKGIADTYFDSYKDGAGLVISVVRTAELENLLKATSAILPDFYVTAAGINTEGIQKYCTFAYGTQWKPEYHDMGSMMNRMASTEEYYNWTAQLNRTVVVNHHTSKWATSYRSFGFEAKMTDESHIANLSIFIPNKKYEGTTDYNIIIKETEWYRDFNAE